MEDKPLNAWVLGLISISVEYAPAGGRDQNLAPVWDQSVWRLTSDTRVECRLEHPIPCWEPGPCQPGRAQDQSGFRAQGAATPGAYPDSEPPGSWPPAGVPGWPGDRSASCSSISGLTAWWRGGPPGPCWTSWKEGVCRLSSIATGIVRTGRCGYRSRRSISGSSTRRSWTAWWLAAPQLQRHRLQRALP